MSLTESCPSVTMPAGRPIDYWLETRRPFCNLVFLLPMLIAYEIGVELVRATGGISIRNGADAWMRLWLHQAGIESGWWLPLLLLGTLVAWHLTSRQPWQTTWETIGGMAAESVLYAFLLIMLGQFTDYALRHASSMHLQLEVSVEKGYLIRLVTFMGAGIYEEFLFRLCLLPLTYAAFRMMMVPRGWSIVGTVLSTSLIFSLAHYLGPSTDGHALALITDAITRVQSSRELWFGFAFRTMAGMFFSALYFFRGFGITVGAHAAYDVVVGVVLISEV